MERAAEKESPINDERAGLGERTAPNERITAIESANS